MKGLLAGLAATALAVGALAVAGVFSGGGGQPPALSFKTGPAAGIPGLNSLGQVAGGVADATINTGS